MKKNLVSIVLIITSFSTLAFGQMGINTNEPKATLDVRSSADDASKIDGVIIPKLTGDQLKSKDALYTGDQTGTIIFSTAAVSSTPAGKTVNVTSQGFYYFDGVLWQKVGREGDDWQKEGNTGTTAAASTIGTNITTGNFLGTTDSQNLVFATNKNVKAILDTNGNLTGGNANTSGSYASFAWGSNNTLVNNTSSNVAIGRNNTVSAQGVNFPALAIGYSNSANNGAKIIGNANNATGSSTFVFGNANGNGTPPVPVSGFTIGNQNENSGGYVFGTGNNASTNNYIFGNKSKANGSNSMVFGFNTIAYDSQSVYANTLHVFSGPGPVASSITDVGINMLPSVTNFADLEVSKAILIKANTKPTCDNSNEGTIMYELSGTTGNFLGCRNNGVAFVWAQLNN